MNAATGSQPYRRQMPTLATPSSLAALDVAPSPIVVRCVVDDPEYLDVLRDGLERFDRLDVHATGAPEDATTDLDAVDCVVSDYDVPGTTGVDLLAAVRERDPALPFVLLTNERRPEVLDPVAEAEWADCFQKGDGLAATTLLGRRIGHLVDHKRAAALAGRALAGVETADAGIALAAPDGTLQYVNGALAAAFDADPAALVGRSWRTLFPEAVADRIAADALPTVAEDWQWVGGCLAHRPDGERFPTRTTVTGTDDGALVFTVRERDADAD